MREITWSISVVLLLILMSSTMLAQSFEIGHATFTLTDQSRNREIEVEIYYPAETAGDDVPVSAGSHPVLVFGHGFLMAWSAYENFWEELVPEGYVLCFPTTEGGISPDHADLGLDMAYIAAQMQQQNTNSNSPFFDVLTAKTAVMGHSMGGGAAVLAAEDCPDCTALVNFAAAETNPSASTAAAQVSLPTLLFSGEADCVTPPADHQDLMYDNSISNCKTQVTISEGGHCYFANSNFACDLGEATCGDINISREEQQTITFALLKPWLRYILRDEPTAWTEFNDLLQNQQGTAFRQDCQLTSVSNPLAQPDFRLFPNPATTSIQLKLPQRGAVTITNPMGQVMTNISNADDQLTMDVSQFPAGVYLLNYRNAKGRVSKRWVKQER